MRLCRFYSLLLCLCLLQFSASACFYRDPVRHLSSDICLITPNLSKEEVISYLGMPDAKKDAPEGEVWTYTAVKKSTLRKTPFIGQRMGTEQYDVVTITFNGDRVYTCIYRSFDEEEFKKSGIKVNEPPANE